MLEVADSPDDLGILVPPVGQGEDHVIVGLGQGRAVPRKGLLAFPVGLEDCLVYIRRFLLQPGQQCRPEIEADLRVVVGHLDNPAPLIQDAGFGVRGITLRGDPFVPVVVRIRRVLELDGLKPRVLAGWLVEVAVNADVPFH